MGGAHNQDMAIADYACISWKPHKGVVEPGRAGESGCVYANMHIRTYSRTLLNENKIPL